MESAAEMTGPCENPVEILIADSQVKVRRALCVLLEGQPGWRVVGTAADARELVRMLAALRPQVLLLDWGLPGLDAAGFFSSRDGDGMGVVVISADPELRQQALRLGARRFVSKVDSPKLLIEAIRSCEEEEFGRG